MRFVSLHSPQLPPPLPLTTNSLDTLSSDSCPPSLPPPPSSPLAAFTRFLPPSPGVTFCLRALSPPLPSLPLPPRRSAYSRALGCRAQSAREAGEEAVRRWRCRGRVETPGGRRRARRFPAPSREGTARLLQRRLQPRARSRLRSSVRELLRGWRAQSPRRGDREAAAIRPR